MLQQPALHAILFDMDGILVDSEAYWYQSRIDFATERGLAWTMDDQKAAMGRNTVEWAAVMRERLHLADPLETIMADVMNRVIGRLEARLPLLPGALEAVHTAAAYRRVGLASGSPTPVIETVMRLTGLGEVFEVMVMGDTISHGKPHPAIYFAAAERMGVEAARCVGIEDSGNGVRALHAAGMYAIAIPSPGFPLAAEVLALVQRHLPNLTAFTPGLLSEIEMELATG